MKPPDISVLGYALLGLIHLKPSSGYDLRKTFAETAMGNYSSSPGAIYPALERLESEGLIRGAVENRAGMRRRRVYKATSKGVSELKKWLARPIGQADVMRGAQELMLRFSFMDRALGPDATVAFLTRFRSALKPYLTELESYLSANEQEMPLSGRLALECGIRGYRGLHDWTRYAIRTYRQAQSSPPTRHVTTKQGGPR
jgi:DNA-binding PadR family transcriptional regulator